MKGIMGEFDTALEVLLKRLLQSTKRTVNGFSWTRTVVSWN
jgi:hypothetical protein